MKQTRGIRTPRASDTLIEQLKHDIFSGLLKPGDQLEEADLAARFGVSRTPIREAIRSMVDCGLLETRPRKDIRAYAQGNLAIHAAIHKSSGNAWLVNQLDQIQALEPDADTLERYLRY